MGVGAEVGKGGVDVDGGSAAKGGGGVVEE